ncbi:MAG TPA: hypothetical protein PKA58_28345 [Polyangium sp.]|nr:hypothetical protein [Polyangium sp.]
MKHASILLLTIGLCGFSFLACAEGDDSTFGNKPGTGGNGGEGGKPGTGSSTSSGTGMSSGTTSSSSSSSTGSGNTACMVKCELDSDCQNSCKVPPVGINCCDVGTTPATCPAPMFVPPKAQAAAARCTDRFARFDLPSFHLQSISSPSLCGMA